MTSKIKVDNISDKNDNNIINESGDVITVGAAGDTVAVAGNIVKSNALQASDGGNIVSQSGTTITLGASGDTIALSAGASQSGFGRTGTVDWQTGSVKTSDFTAENGKGFFVNTAGGVVTATLPSSPSAGNIVSIADYGFSAATNKITIGRNSSNISGFAVDAEITVNGAAVTLVYVDGTKGWVAVNDQNSGGIVSQEYVAASGGTITTSGNFKIHTFTGPGTFTVSNAGNAAGSNTVDYLVVAGGGGGGGGHGGGGGAGGYRESSGTASGSYTASPLGACVSALSVTAQGYPIVVGGGGTAGGGYVHSVPSRGGNGNNSVFSTITSTAGGGSGGYNVPGGGPPGVGQNGGSGGGGVGQLSASGGSGNTPPVSPPQGNNGGSSSTPGGGGGGGAGVVGNSPPGGGVGGAGGNGVSTSITGSSVARGGGGGGGAETGPNSAYVGGAGGTGGGGAGKANVPAPTPGGNGTANTGGGGGGGTGGGSPSGPPFGGTGASGIVVIRYKFQ